MIWERIEWPLWQCLSAESMVVLANYQYEAYGTRLNFPTNPYKEVESLDELTKIMQEPPGKAHR